jgi:hypothetical protein
VKVIDDCGEPRLIVLEFLVPCRAEARRYDEFWLGFIFRVAVTPPTLSSWAERPVAFVLRVATYPVILSVPLVFLSQIRILNLRRDAKSKDLLFFSFFRSCLLRVCGCALRPSYGLNICV